MVNLVPEYKNRNAVSPTWIVRKTAFKIQLVTFPYAGMIQVRFLPALPLPPSLHFGGQVGRQAKGIISVPDFSSGHP